MGRSTSLEYVQKVNFAIRMLEAGNERSAIKEVLVAEFGLSARQAFRYLKQAEGQKGPLSAPEEKSVLTIKLPVRVIEAVRRRAKKEGVSLSQWVTEALEKVLRDGKKP